MERRPTTLKEKLNDHWGRKPTVQTASVKMFDKAGIVYVVSAILALGANSIAIIIPELIEKDWIYTRLALIGAYLLIACQVFVNLAFCKLRSAFNHAEKCKNKPQTDQWTSCPTCQVMAPPRSHHCKFCNHCVMKRDIHCFVTGCCIGFFNQQHFIVFLWYSVIGCALSLVLIISYMYQFSSMSYPNYLLFVTLWNWLVSEQVSFPDVYMLTQLYLCVVSLALSTWFLFWEVIIVVNGQTTYEAGRGIHKYKSKSYMAGIHSVFGQFWFIQFVFPIALPQDGDGMNWKLYKDEKHN